MVWLSGVACQTKGNILVSQPCYELIGKCIEADLELKWFRGATPSDGACRVTEAENDLACVIDRDGIYEMDRLDTGTPPAFDVKLG